MKERVQSAFGASCVRACRLAQFSRAAWYRPSQARDQSALRLRNRVYVTFARLPSLSAIAISESAPYRPPTAISASHERTRMTLRAWSIPVTMGTVTNTGWSATAGHTSTTKTCKIAVGGTATNEGEPVC